MNLEEYAQQSLSDSESFQCNNHWAKESNHYYNRKKLCTSYSTPININYSNDEEISEKNQFLIEISQVKQDILRFRSEMNGLAKQMDGMEIDLNHSKDRVREIEKGLTATQEVNVNLQVLLEKAVNTQRESDVYATRAMRHIHTNLATVVYETGQLKGRLSTIANYQKQHQGNVSDVAERMREYTHMLEQAQDTIQSLQTTCREDAMNSLDIRSYSTDDDDEEEDDEEEEEEEEEEEIKKINHIDLYRHRIIKKRISNPEIISNAWLPQKGLRILLTDYNSL